jgi:NitT/TauT family transport system substrate-binding protein
MISPALKQVTPTLTRRGLLLGTAGAGAAMLLASCGDDSETGDGSGAITGQVTVISSFGHLGRDAYLHYGAYSDKNFYGELEVAVEPGQGTAPNLVALSGGAVDFAASDIMAMLVTHGQEPTGAVLLAAVQQQTIAGLMTIDPRIRRPQDLHGRIVALPPGAGSELLFPAWADQAGVDPSQVTIEPLGGAELVPALRAGQVDAIGQFVVGQPLVEAGVGQEVTVLPYSDYLTDTYGVGLWATRELAEQNPDLCRAWRDGTLAALQAALEDPQDVATVLAGVVPETNQEAAAAELQLMRAYTVPPNGALGSVDMLRLEKAVALLMSTGAIADAIDLSDLVMPGLTLGVEP